MIDHKYGRSVDDDPRVADRAPILAIEVRQNENIRDQLINHRTSRLCLIWETPFPRLSAAG